MEPLEAECKFRVVEPQDLVAKLADCGAEFIKSESHRDTYLRHPSRDFRATDEALRLREVNGSPWITYKGPRLEGPIKIRPEIELPLGEGNADQWLQVWGHLGFTVVAQVIKERQVYRWMDESVPLTITLDHVLSLGHFAEIERVLADRSEIEFAQRQILGLARRLDLTVVEKRSYLGLLLDQAAR